MKGSAYLIKQALGGSILSAQMTRPFTEPPPVPPAHTLEDQRTLNQLFASLPPSRRKPVLRAVYARMRVHRP